MPKYIFKSKCPACDNNRIITWHHAGCPSYSKQYLDDEGDIYCDGCDSYFDFCDCTFSCESHTNDYREIDLTRLEAIFSVALTMPIAGCNAREFRKNLIRSIRRRWQEKHPFDDEDDEDFGNDEDDEDNDDDDDDGNDDDDDDDEDDGDDNEYVDDEDDYC